MPRFSQLPAASWLVTCIAVVLGGMYLRLHPLELAWAWPVVGPGATVASAWQHGLAAATGGIALGAAVLSALLLFAALGRVRALPDPRPWAELICFLPTILAFIWLVTSMGRPRPREWIIGGLLLAAAAWLLRGSRWPGSRRRTGYGRARIWLLDLLVIAAPALLGLAMGNDLHLQAVGVSLLTYPLYALVQLAVFLVIPAHRLQRLGLSRPATALCCSLVFALIHWPNPTVMLATFLTMGLWSWQYLGGRRLWHLALVMGLAATSFSQFLPDELTNHVRVGPRFVRVKAMRELGRWPLGGGPAADPLPAEYLAAVHPQILFREAELVELQRWTTAVDRANLTTMAWQFFCSDEYQALSHRDPGRWPPAPPPWRHWTQWPEPWQARVSAFGADTYWQAHGADLAGFLRGLYGDILQREPSAGEVDSWSWRLSVGQRTRLAEILLDRYPQYRLTPFDTLSAREIRLPN